MTTRNGKDDVHLTRHQETRANARLERIVDSLDRRSHTRDSCIHKSGKLMIPPFDPSKDDFVIEKWIEHVDELAAQYNKAIMKLIIVDSPDVRAIKKQLRDDDAASARKRERKEEEKEEEEKEKEEKVNETFERPETSRKFDDRSHDRVQPIISTPRTTIVSTIESLKVFETTH
ncbi:hypothetical protein ALC56_03010 [Trachymyrmex septentrionalis]|uniref:Uncharacterized protein n=1 Tax=Trachymyrmex septentrionalis TaxID=34720 RepID=A0A151JZP4_9HYME|nr:hypothetical protein ALC56_03010 [Trachymyrmex septentrionalis]